jgi:hypothetical protein
VYVGRKGVSCTTPYIATNPCTPLVLHNRLVYVVASCVMAARTSTTCLATATTWPQQTLACSHAAAPLTCILILPHCCRDIHNVFGYYYHLATAEGLLHRGTDVALFGEHGDRPFVLSRAFFSGASFASAYAAGFCM